MRDYLASLSRLVSGLSFINSSVFFFRASFRLPPDPMFFYLMVMSTLNMISCGVWLIAAILLDPPPPSPRAKE